MRYCASVCYSAFLRVNFFWFAFSIAYSTTLLSSFILFLSFWLTPFIFSICISFSSFGRSGYLSSWLAADRTVYLYGDFEVLEGPPTGALPGDYALLRSAFAGSRILGWLLLLTPGWLFWNCYWFANGFDYWLFSY